MKRSLILWRKGVGMFLEGPFIETCIIHYMLLEDKLKEISLKGVG